jgi:hypothetical protein
MRRQNVHEIYSFALSCRLRLTFPVPVSIQAQPFPTPAEEYKPTWEAS